MKMYLKEAKQMIEENISGLKAEIETGKYKKHDEKFLYGAISALNLLGLISEDEARHYIARIYSVLVDNWRTI